MQQETKPNFWVLTPLIVFLLIYLVASIIMGDFYKMPITVAGKQALGIPTKSIHF